MMTFPAILLILLFPLLLLLLTYNQLLQHDR